MRKSGKWMVLLDERILELFSESDEEFLSPSEIADNKRITYSSQYVGQRCRKLAEHGLLFAVGNGIYRITEEGKAYLREEYDASETSDVEMSDESEMTKSEGKDGA